MVLVRKQFLQFVERMHVDEDNVVLLRMKKALLGTDKNVIFIAAYLQPYWKAMQHGYDVQIIENCITDLYGVTDDFPLLLSGDLKARTAPENYNQVQDDCEEVFDKI